MSTNYHIPAVQFIALNKKTMFKTFRTLAVLDSSWGGGSIQHYNDHLEKMDELINGFSENMGLKVDNIFYSMVNENEQCGPDSRNTTRRIYLVAGVVFSK